MYVYGLLAPLILMLQTDEKPKGEGKNHNMSIIRRIPKKKKKKSRILRIPPVTHCEITQ